MPKNPLEKQLKETSQLTGARWAIWLEHNVDWEILASYKIKAHSRAAVLEYIRKPNLIGWLNGALAGKHSRSLSILKATGLAGTKLYIFPDQMTQRVILVGADQLSNVAQRYWRVVAMGNPSRSFLDPSIDPILSNIDLGIPYHLPEALDRILELVLRTAGCKTGWLAIRSGDFFEIKGLSRMRRLCGYAYFD